SPSGWGIRRGPPLSAAARSLPGAACGEFCLAAPHRGKIRGECAEIFHRTACGGSVAGMRGREKSRWLIRRFARDDAGAAFLVFALGIFLTLWAIALAFDLSRFFLAKTRLSFTIEMAAVAAAEIGRAHV